MSEYEHRVSDFEWEQVWDEFKGKPDDFNVGHEAVGKYDTNSNIAIRIVDFEGPVSEYSYSDLNDAASQFANLLSELGYSRDDRVAGLLEPRIELFATIFGTWISGMTYVPLYTLFGPEALNYRLEDSNADVLVTSAEHVHKIDDELETLEHVVLVDEGDQPEQNCIDFESVWDLDTSFNRVRTAADDLLALQYTSGTTGPPKGVEVQHSGMVSYYPYANNVVNFQPDDTFCTTAPPAWVMGLVFTTPYPLHRGIGTTLFRGKFDVATLVDCVETYDVTKLFVTPTALRQAAQLDVDWDERAIGLRSILSGGETVGSEIVSWCRDALDVDVLESYGSTEAGMVMGNLPLDEWALKPGSMGKPLPGFDVQLFDTETEEVVEDGETGEIAVRFGAGISLGSAYLNEPAKTREKFGGEWMRLEDLATRDEDGYFWFEGRKDDVILSSGYRIGPTEVEESLMKLDVVAETAVVGLPHETRGEVVTAFVVLADDVEPSSEVASEIQTSVKRRLSMHEYPRRVEFVESLPKTPTGKIQRHKLRDDTTDR